MERKTSTTLHQHCSVRELRILILGFLVIGSLATSLTHIPDSQAAGTTWPNCAAPTVITLSLMESVNLTQVPDKRSLNPPCDAYYELDGMMIASVYTAECGLVSLGFCDIHLQFDCSVAAGCLFEIDQTWQAAGYTYPSVTPGNIASAKGFFFVDDHGIHEFHPVTSVTLGSNPPPPPPALTSSFTISPIGPAVNMPVTFTDTSAGGTLPYVISWNFGDGGIGSGTAIVHTYSSVNTFTVTETVTDSSTPKQSNTSIQTVNISPTPLSPSFTFSPPNPLINSQVAFAASAIGGAAPYTYNWSFGDGSTGKGSSLTHTYTTSGAFTVTLTVTDSIGTSSSTLVSLTVSLPAPLTGSFYILPSTPLAGQTVMITGTATGGQAPYNYIWQFGDGATATGSSTNHIYFSPGAFTVILTFTDSKSETATYSKTIDVLRSSPPPLATYLTFTNPSGADISNQVTWEISDGGDPIAIGNPALLNTTSTYELDVFYNNRLVVSRVFSPQPLVTTTVYMFPHQSTTNGYVAFNSTIANFSLSDQSSSNLRFTAVGASGKQPVAYMLVVKVPKAPVLVLRDRSNYPFSFDRSNSVVVIESPTLADWTLTFEATGNPPPSSNPPSGKPHSPCQLCVNTKNPVYFLGLLVLGGLIGLVLTLIVFTTAASKRLSRTRRSALRRRSRDGHGFSW